MCERALGENGYLCERHDGEEAEAEAEGSIPVEVMSDGAERDEDEEDIKVRCKEEPLEGLAPARLAVGLDEADEARDQTGRRVVF